MSALLLLGLLVSSPEGAAPTWCASMQASLLEVDAEAADAREALRVIADRLPDRFRQAMFNAKLHLAEDGEPHRAVTVLRAAAVDGCRGPAPAPEAMRAEVEAILAEGGFERTREEPDLIDIWLERLQSWLFELLESEGMQRYAEGSRFIYLTALVLTGLWVARRLWLASRRRRVLAAEQEDDVIERERLRGARDLLADAHAALGGDPRRAVLLGFLALLARVGEHAPGAVAPALTNREILARLPSGWVETCRPLFARYEKAVYAEVLAAGEAPAFLAAVASAVEGK